MVTSGFCTYLCTCVLLHTYAQVHTHTHTYTQTYIYLSYTHKFCFSRRKTGFIRVLCVLCYSYGLYHLTSMYSGSLLCNALKMTLASYSTYLIGMSILFVSQFTETHIFYSLCICVSHPFKFIFLEISCLDLEWALKCYWLFKDRSSHDRARVCRGGSGVDA